MSGMGCVCSCDLALFDWRAGSCSSGTKTSSPSQLLFRVVLAWTHLLFSRHPLVVRSPLQRVPTVVSQELVPSSSQSSWRGYSAAQPQKTRHIHCVSGCPCPQVKHPHVVFPSKVRDLPRLVVLDEGLVLTQVDVILDLRDLGNTWDWALHWTDLPDDPSTLSLIHSTSHRPFAHCGSGFPPEPQRTSLGLEAVLGFSGIHCIIFSGRAFASAPLVNYC